MPKLRISSLEGRALLDIASYARRGPGHRDRLSSEEIAHIGRTVRRTPEVMVKVLSKDSNNLRSVARHLNYIGRRGELELETDDGEHIQGRRAGIRSRHRTVRTRISRLRRQWHVQEPRQPRGQPACRAFVHCDA